MDGLWYLKNRVLGGKILATAHTKEEVQRQADDLNRDLQTDAYYVEEHDPNKPWYVPKTK